MNRNILILLFVLFSLQIFAKVGSNKDFWILSRYEYDDRVQNGKDVVLRRYIVVPDIDNNYKDIFETTDEKALLAKFSFMLKKNKSALMEKYIMNCDNTLDINDVIKGLYYFSENQYDQAIVYLEKSGNEEYTFLKLMLIADCKYELLQDKKNYKSIIGEYQIAIDKTDNELNKTIINNRIKYIKYR